MRICEFRNERHPLEILVVSLILGPCIRLAPPGPVAGGGNLRLLYSSNHLLSSLAVGRAPPTRRRAVKTLPGGQEADSRCIWWTRNFLARKGFTLPHLTKGHVTP